jgi:hypothetical protein
MVWSRIARPTRHRYGRPSRIKPSDPASTILAVEQRWFPNKEDTVIWENAPDHTHRVELARRLKMVERLADPYDIDLLMPIGKRLDKVAVL